MTDYAAARHNMVEGQIKPNRVTDRVLIEVFASIPRELFVLQAARGIAYVDEDIPIAKGRWLIEPRVIGRLLNDAQIEPTDTVLDIGAGTGYAACVGSRLANSVVAVESDPELAGRASALLGTLGIGNVAVEQAPLTQGYPPRAPYQVIVIEGAVAEVPQAILAQLAEGGRLVTVIKRSGGLGGCASLFQRTAGSISRRELFEAATPILPGFEPKPVFQF